VTYWNEAAGAFGHRNVADIGKFYGDVSASCNVQV
jgi:hypothetical protein